MFVCKVSACTISVITSVRGGKVFKKTVVLRWWESITG